MPSRNRVRLERARARRLAHLQKSQEHRRKLEEDAKQQHERRHEAKRQTLSKSQMQGREMLKRSQEHRRWIAGIEPDLENTLKRENVSLWPGDNLKGEQKEEEYERQMQNNRKEGTEEDKKNDEDDENDFWSNMFSDSQSAPRFRKKSKKKVRIAKERDWIPTRETIRHVIKSHLKTLRLVTARRTYPRNATNPRLHILAQTPIRKTLVTLSAIWHPRTKTLSHLKRLSTFQKVKTVDEWHAHHRKASGAKFLPCH